MPKEKTDPVDVVTSYSESLRDDIHFLKSLSVEIITVHDISRLRRVAMQHGIKDTVTEKSFEAVLCKTLYTIEEKFANYVFSGVLERIREKDIGKKQRGLKNANEEVPESLRD